MAENGLYRTRSNNAKCILIWLKMYLQTETHRILEEIKVLRETMKAVADDTRAKEQLHKQLVWC